MRKNCAQFVRDEWTDVGLTFHNLHTSQHSAGPDHVKSHSFCRCISTVNSQVVHKHSSASTGVKNRFPTVST